MKYNISINQRAAIEHFQSADIVDIAILDFIIAFSNTAVCQKKIRGKKTYFYFSWRLISEQMPILNLNSRQGIYKRLKRLEDLKLIQAHPANQKDGEAYFCFTNLLELYLSDMAISAKKIKAGVNERLQGGVNERLQGGVNERLQGGVNERLHNNINIPSIISSNSIRERPGKLKIKAGKKQKEKSSAKKEEGPVILSDLENGMYSSYQEFIKMHSGLLKQDQPEYIRQNMQTIIQAFRNGIKQDEFTTDVDGQILEAFKFMMQRFNDWPEFNRRRVLLHELAKDLTNIQLAIRSRLKGMPKSNYIEDQISKLKKAS